MSLVSCHTIKPLDRDGIEQALHTHKHVIVIEEHARKRVAPQTKQIAWDTAARCRLDTFTLKDEFIHNYGSYENLLASHGISRESILTQIGNP